MFKRALPSKFVELRYDVVAARLYSDPYSQGKRRAGLLFVSVNICDGWLVISWFFHGKGLFYMPLFTILSTWSANLHSFRMLQAAWRFTQTPTNSYYIHFIAYIFTNKLLSQLITCMIFQERNRDLNPKFPWILDPSLASIPYWLSWRVPILTAVIFLSCSLCCTSLTVKRFFSIRTMWRL